MFEHNVGKMDRMVRIVLGVALLCVGVFFIQPPVSLIVALVGLILVITGVTGTCALYGVLGINTASGKAGKPPERMPKPGAKMAPKMPPKMAPPKAAPKKYGGMKGKKK